MNEASLAFVVLLAFAIDRWLGDPPNRFHPVAWMGSFIALAKRRAPAHGNARRFVFGLLLLIAGVVMMTACGLLAEKVTSVCPLVVGIVLQACLLKSTFSLRSLVHAAKQVETPLKEGNLVVARQQLSYHLVSRDVSELNTADVSAATIESIAENTSDSVVAPLLYFAIAGLPGALVYRFVNTCDAMLGYRTPELEWLGKASARLDDVLNLVPARLTAIVMILVGGIREANLKDAFRFWMRDHALTASPNAGHPMSAAAGVLGVSLEKKGHYLLGMGLRSPDVNDIGRAIRLVWVTSVTSIAVVMGLRLIMSRLLMED
jgi:adenosylcobinamide-phosphate synthase